MEGVRDIREMTTKSLADITPKPSAMPKAMSRTERRSAFMLRQRKPSRHSSSRLTERISPISHIGDGKQPPVLKRYRGKGDDD